MSEQHDILLALSKMSAAISELANAVVKGGQSAPPEPKQGEISLGLQPAQTDAVGADTGISPTPAPKRGKGRPKGSKNKPKVSLSDFDHTLSNAPNAAISSPERRVRDDGLVQGKLPGMTLDELAGATTNHMKMDAPRERYQPQTPEQERLVKVSAENPPPESWHDEDLDDVATPDESEAEPTSNSSLPYQSETQETATHQPPATKRIESIAVPNRPNEFLRSPEAKADRAMVAGDKALIAGNQRTERRPEAGKVSVVCDRCRQMFQVSPVLVRPRFMCNGCVTGGRR